MICISINTCHITFFDLICIFSIIICNYFFCICILSTIIHFIYYLYSFNICIRLLICIIQSIELIQTYYNKNKSELIVSRTCCIINEEIKLIFLGLLSSILWTPVESCFSYEGSHILHDSLLRYDIIIYGIWFPVFQLNLRFIFIKKLKNRIV